MYKSYEELGVWHRSLDRGHDIFYFVYKNSQTEHENLQDCVVCRWVTLVVMNIDQMRIELDEARKQVHT